MIQQYGPDAVGVYFGNGSIFNSTAVTMQAHFLDALGSRSRFTSYTIDQSAKTLSFERLGGWAGGNLQLDQSDVVMLIGTNPLLSHGLLGFLASDPTKRLKEAKARELSGLPGEKIDLATHGASTNMLISTDRDVEPINVMPRMSAIPVNIVVVEKDAAPSAMAGILS